MEIENRLYSKALVSQFTNGLATCDREFLCYLTMMLALIAEKFSMIHLHVGAENDKASKLAIDASEAMSEMLILMEEALGKASLN